LRPGNTGIPFTGKLQQGYTVNTGDVWQKSQ
jgi:hypothetical protein